MSLWLVRGGENGCFETVALRKGLTVVNWAKLPSFMSFENKSQIKEALREQYPDARDSQITRWFSQIWSFRSVISIGDLIGMPIKGKQHFL